jgi:tRNA G10  N-methylase Trm11
MQLGPMEVRVVHEFERPRVGEMSENQRRLQMEALRFGQPRVAKQQSWAALRARVAAQIAGVRQMVATGITWEQQSPAEECG